MQFPVSVLWFQPWIRDWLFEMSKITDRFIIASVAIKAFSVISLHTITTLA